MGSHTVAQPLCHCDGNRTAPWGQAKSVPQTMQTARHVAAKRLTKHLRHWTTDNPYCLHVPYCVCSHPGPLTLLLQLVAKTYGGAAQLQHAATFESQACHWGRDL
jgi:hypothetical protein